MFESTSQTLARSWQLLTRSLQVLVEHRKLLIFPIVSSACAVVMALFFLSPAVFYPSGHPVLSGAHWESLADRLEFLLPNATESVGQNQVSKGLVYGYAAIVYLTSMFLATFFNVAYFSEIMKALAGDAVSVRAGLRFAWQRLPAILVWSLFAGAVGLVIKLLEERLGWVGRWVMRAIGVAWSVASVFVIPVIIRNGGTNPLALLRDSANTLRRTWGEALVGYVGITFGSWIVLLGSLVLLGGAVVLGSTMHLPWLIVIAFAAWFLAMMILTVATTMAGTVYRCALYVYASEGVVPEPYTADLMDGAWKVRKP